MKVTGGHESRFPLNALADDGRMAAPERAGAAASQHSVPSVPSSPTQPSSLWLCAKFSQYYSSRALCRHQYTHHMHQLMAVLQVIQCITPPPGSLAIMAASQQTLLCTLAVATQEACRPCGRACVGGRRPASQQAAGGTWHTQRAKLCRAAAGHKCAAEGMALIWIWTQVCAHTHGTCRGTTRLTCSQLQGFTNCCKVLAAAQPLHSVCHRLWRSAALPPCGLYCTCRAVGAGGLPLSWRHTLNTLEAHCWRLWEGVGEPLCA